MSVVDKYIDMDVVMSEREEGEISDLDLEDVSDCSLSVGKSPGQTKTVQYVRDLSFSSISDSDSTSSIILCSKCGSVNCNGRHCSRRKHKINKCKCVNNKHSAPHHTKSLHRYKTKMCRTKCINRKSRQVESISSDSDSDDVDIDKSLLKNLNKAVRVKSPIPETLQTSLRTRLKNMLNGVANKSDDSESELDIAELRKLALKSKLGDFKNDVKSSINANDIVHSDNKTTLNHVGPNDNAIFSSEKKDDNFIDDEANELRLVALRSAILKKHEARKRKMKEKDKISNPNNEDVPNINNHLLNEKIDTNDLEEHINEQIRQELLTKDMYHERLSNNSDTEKNENNIADEVSFNSSFNKSVEEDEDILRAMLLSSISKKIANSDIELISNTNIESNIVQNESLNKLSSSKNVPFSVNVQPLIINVNSDSESDAEDLSNPPEVFQNKFEESLSQFLRNARAEVEKQQTEKLNSIQPTVKILPSSRQMEYARLRKRLDILSHNKYKTQKCLSPITIGHNTLSKNSGKSQSKKFTKSSAEIIVSNENKVLLKPLKSRNVIVNNQIKHLKENYPTKKRINDIKSTGKSNMPKRFLEGKYRSLAPIVKQTKAARIARDQAGEEVNQLIENLRIAKLNYIECHQEYKTCVQKYLNLKSSIEGEMLKSNTLKRVSNENHNGIEKKYVKIDLNNSTERVLNQSLQEKNIIEEKPLPETHLKSDSIQLSTPDINDENIIKNIKRHANQNDPTIEICPFDLQGSCRDAECEYRHFD